MNSSKFQHYWEDMWILLNFPEYDISMGESHYISEQKPHRKKLESILPGTGLVTVAYRQRTRISGEMDPLYYL
jgi:hypothetical protein